MQTPTIFFSLLTLSFSLLSTTTAFPPPSSLSSLSVLPSDAIALLSFKSKADLDNKLIYRLTERYDYCQWQGIKCAQGRVVRITLQNFGLRGTFPPDTLSQLDQLRTLSLRNNSLTGSLPDLTNLTNLKTLGLSHNMFRGVIPFWVLSKHKLKILDLSFNNFSGSIPVGLNKLVRLSVLKLEFNGFDGFMPALDLRSLVVFNVTGNNLTGKVPATPMLLRFGRLSFLGNEGLCGEVVNKGCPGMKPPFGSNYSNGLMPVSGPSQGAAVAMAPPAAKKRGNRIGLVLGLIIGFGVVLAACLLVLAFVRRGQSGSDEGKSKQTVSSSSQVVVDAHHSSSVVQPQPQREQQCGEVVGMASKIQEDSGMVSKIQEDSGMVSKIQEVTRSGDLVFCAGQARVYSMDQLMRASAELLGRGTIGITYKAVLDSQLIVTVKRLDASKTAITSSEGFERHMAVVGGLWHPNLVPIRAYFQAKGERLVIYEYRPNGSLFNLVHGSRSARAKPLHWTSCLKIAEDVAQGLAYIHQTSKLVHGNLKSTNVLLGADFEACITDCCLAVLADLTSGEDPDSAAYRAPESRKSSQRATSKSDVYAFGVLLLELLSGKPPSQHPFLVPTELPDWVRAMRDDDGGEENQLGMLTEVAGLCRVTSPEQRPAMWQVLNMIQEIKETGLAEDNTMGFS